MGYCKFEGILNKIILEKLKANLTHEIRFGDAFYVYYDTRLLTGLMLSSVLTEDNYPAI